MEDISKYVTVTVTAPDELAYETLNTLPGRALRVVKQRSKEVVGGTVRIIQVEFIPVHF